MSWPAGPKEGRGTRRRRSWRRMPRSRPLSTASGGVEIQGFNYRARFLPKWHDLCQRVLGRQLEAAPDLERLQAVRDAVVGYRGEPERLDRRATTPPPEVPTVVANQETARWAVETARRVIREFHEAAGREVPAWTLERTGHQGTAEG